MDDLQKGVATPGFKKVADDLKYFATGGLIGMVATTTNEHEPARRAGSHRHGDLQGTERHRRHSRSTTPKLTFRWLSQNQDEIGFTRAELTRFNSNLDGSARPATGRPSSISPRWKPPRRAWPPRRSRRSPMIWPKFADGGLDALLGEETK